MNRFVLEKIVGPSGVSVPKDAVGGEFTSSSPQGASKKAFSRIYRKMGRPDRSLSFMIYLRKTNTTDLRVYKVSREVLKEPRTFMRDGVEITVEYTVVSKYVGIEAAKTPSPKRKPSPKKKPSPKRKPSPKKKPSPKRKPSPKKKPSPKRK